jgi:SNF2 family DNA or RNA helicase
LELDEVDVAITTYGLLRNDLDKFKDKKWDMVIIDEAQNIKNPDAAQSIAVKSIKTGTYIAMTGTPVENRLSELWSIFDFTNKGYLGNISNFQRNYALPIEKNRDTERIDKLKLVTEPFVLRRLKNDKSIISDLPDKIVFDEYCYLTKEQAALYEKVLENSFKAIESKTGIHRKGDIFRLITSLKQICNHPVQYTKLDKLSKELSGKAEKTFSIIEQIFEQDEKAIIFTQYKEMGDLLVRMLKDELKIDVPFFHGSVSRTQRDQMVEKFQSDDSIKLMIISLKAGGTGLNLTAATNVIHYDLWWNPAVEDQATDRTYRIGQTHNVIVHRLITLGTFEEKIDEMLKSKKELADLTVSTGEKMITELSDRELREIFSLARF